MTSSRPWPWPRVLAHRGGGVLAPENTLAALRVGHAHGFRAVEFDAMLPSDDVPILMHDDALARTTGRAGLVVEHTADELARLDAGGWHSAAYAGEPVPTLAAALAYCRQQAIWANVEIKPAAGHDERTGAAVAACVARAYADCLRGDAGAAPTLASLPLLSSFSEAALLAARRAAPALPRALLVDRVPEDWRARAEQHAAVSLNVNHRWLSAEQAASVKAAGLWLLCYTVNEPERARQLLTWGVDAICTDAIDAIGPDLA